MPRVAADLLEGRAGNDPVLELALATALLHEVAAGRRGPVIRVYRPQPTVAFGRRDSFLDGFGDAADAARDHGFTPVIRSAGGRAAAYHDECLVIDEIVGSGNAMADVDARFEAEADSQALALRGLGIDARVGEVPGEYCPGRFSVNARGAVKLIGAAQRIIGGAWLFSAVVVVGGGAAIRSVLEDVYGALGLDWDPATAGSISDERAGTMVEEVRDALLAQLTTSRYALAISALTDDERAAAQELVTRHRVSPSAAR